MLSLRATSATLLVVQLAGLYVIVLALILVVRKRAIIEFHPQMAQAV